MTRNNVITYAQNREDLYLFSYLSDIKNGFYIDVGAHDPVKDSVTKLFYKQGWTGINIEPQKELFAKIQKDRKKDINLNIGISNKAGKLKLRQFPGGGLSTFSSEMKEQYEHDERMKLVPHEDYEVDVRTLKSVFENEAKGKKVHFVKIDVEGLEYEVIQGNDWKKHRPTIICIESNHLVKDWHPLLESADYTKIFFDGLNDYYVVNEEIERANKFLYPELFLSKGLILPYEADRELKVLHKELKDLYGKYAELKDERDSINYSYTQLQHKYRVLEDSMMSVRRNLHALKSSVGRKVKRKIKGEE